MSQKRNSRPSIQVAFVVSLLVITVAGGLAYKKHRWHSSVPPLEKYEVAHVQRTDLYPAVTAGGRVESSKRTVIQCELENIGIGVQGQRLWAGGSSILISIVPEGSMVHRGDVLAVLDSSEYEELSRQQKMTVERSRADHPCGRTEQ